MPAPPASALATQTDAPYAAAAAPPDPNVQQELQQADQQAQQTEQQVMAEATPPADAEGGAAPAAAAAATPAAQAAPVTIAIGQTTTDVALNRGRPKQIVNLGPKTIWVYDDMKIIFINGKVNDVQ